MTTNIQLFRAIIERSQKKKRGITIYFSGQKLIGIVKQIVEDEAVELVRNIILQLSGWIKSKRCQSVKDFVIEFRQATLRRKFKMFITWRVKFCSSSELDFPRQMSGLG